MGSPDCLEGRTWLGFLETRLCGLLGSHLSQHIFKNLSSHLFKNKCESTYLFLTGSDNQNRDHNGPLSLCSWWLRHLWAVSATMLKSDFLLQLIMSWISSVSPTLSPNSQRLFLPIPLKSVGNVVSPRQTFDGIFSGMTIKAWIRQKSTKRMFTWKPLTWSQFMKRVLWMQRHSLLQLKSL